MTIWQLIQKRIDEGWELQAGHHYEGHQGYWACFIREDAECCKECDEVLPVDWDESGHAWKLDTAIIMADRVAQGEEIKVPNSSVFEEETPQ